MATRGQMRTGLVETAQSYMGVKQGSKKHKALIDLFNQLKPDGWAMTYSAYWCAASASAFAMETFGISHAKKMFPLSANCGTIITKAKAMGAWKERDSYKPHKGDWILYDWQDNGVGDNQGSPDHVGTVEKVTATHIYVIEGNKNKKVDRRIIKRDGKYIRGFVVPKYGLYAKPHTDAWYLREKLRSMVQYMNKHHYGYVGSASKMAKTWEGSKKVKKANCAMFISYALQELGYIKKGEYFYIKGLLIHCKGGLTKKKLAKYFDIRHPLKKPKDANLKRGDICGYANPPHTQDFYAFNRHGDPTWFSWGSTDVGDKQPKVKGSYNEKRVPTVMSLKIRLK